ncbi:MAG: queuosine precursor transporter [Phycisphaerales bacterium]
MKTPASPTVAASPPTGEPLRPGEVPPGQTFSRQQQVYVWLTAFFVACLIIADVIGVRLFSIHLGPWTVEHTCGMLTFPVTFLLTDLINEYFGTRSARRVTIIGFCMGAFVFGVINLSMAMPRLDAPFNVPEQSFRDVFSSAQVMFMASLVAFLIGQFADIAVFGLLKRLTRGKLLWLRATGSTVISQTIDSFVVTALAFNLGRRAFGGEVMPMLGGDSNVLKTAATGYTLKFVIALLITPIIYLGHGIMKRHFGLVPIPAETR